MKNNKEITNFAIIELAIFFIATLLCLFIKIYTNYDFGWIICFYPLFVFLAFNVCIIIHGFYLLITSKPIKLDKEDENVQ